MAIRRKHHRKIVVAGRTYHWGCVWFNDGPGLDVRIFAKDTPHEARLNANYLGDAVTPDFVRRIIEVGLASRWDPDGSESYMLSDDEMRDASQCFARSLSHGGHSYAWQPDFHGGLHLKIRRAAPANGQLLATTAPIKEDDLSEELAIAAIKNGLGKAGSPRQAGWIASGWKMPSRKADHLSPLFQIRKIPTIREIRRSCPKTSRDPALTIRPLVAKMHPSQTQTDW